MNDFFPLIFILIAVFGVGVFVMSVIANAKRRKALQAWADSQGLSLDPSRQYGYDDRFTNFEALRKGSNRYAHTVISGDIDGLGVRCFDYHYQTTSTDSKGRRRTNHHHFSAVIIAHGLPFDSLFIRPEGFFDKVTEFFGHDDIDFELDAFSRAFYVKGPNRQFAFDVIHQDTMEFMLAAPRFTMDFEGPEVMVYRGGRFKPSDYEAAVAIVRGMLDRLPNYLLNEMKGKYG